MKREVMLHKKRRGAVKVSLVKKSYISLGIW